VSRCTKSDEGFSLMEAVVAAGLLGLAAVVVATLMFGTLRVTTDSARRTAAATIAASQIEAVRQVSATDIPDGKVSLPPQTIGGTTFSVVQEATYTTYNGSVSACTGTGTLAGKRVTVTVTWPAMGTTKPVTTETLRSLGFDASSGGLDRTKGSAAVYVLDSAGEPVNGAQVLLRSGSGATLGTQATGTDGCAVFTNLTAGQNVYAEASRTGHVSIDGQDSVADTGSGVIANSVVKSTLQLDLPGQLAMTTSLPGGAVLPVSSSPASFTPHVTTTLWPSISSTRIPPSCATASPPQVCLSASTPTLTQVSRLFPGAYGVWLGACQDARPVTVPLTAVVAGAAAAVTVPIGAVSVRTTDGALTGRTVVAGHAADAGCPTGDTIQLATLPAPGASVEVALPPGSWTVSLDDHSAAVPVTVTGGAVTSVTVG
jgi:Tfp pilus assembly protein PilV